MSICESEHSVCGISMPKILIVYYSHTENTEKMAKAIVEGARTVQQVEVELKRHELPSN
jgi:flavodoxin